VLAWSRAMDGPPVHSTALGGSEIQERTRSGKDKLERHRQEISTKMGVDSPGKRHRQRPLTDKNGVGEWPNVFTWMWVGPRLSVTKLSFTLLNSSSKAHFRCRQ